ncbi:LON peptidase substrate-binding domain-containing protein [Microbaculum marinum]|uniref:LON peptidase substrate-binding domain-containing protein n=1 Tax=Microbaculum marinum TaxID=1764581 RepID=A0AAW9RST5_9HYPH
MTINRPYHGPRELPQIVPVFPLSGVLLLPRGDLPLNIFEPRYLKMIDDVLAGDRMIGIIQPAIGAQGPDEREVPALADIGCVGRVTALQETGDDRYLITVTGISRFRVVEELEVTTPYRQCRITTEPFGEDFTASYGEDAVDRQKLLATFRAFLDANDMETDWESVNRASNETLVNALSMLSPYGPREKQALLEADDLNTRAEVLIAVTEMALARDSDDFGPSLQ